MISRLLEASVSRLEGMRSRPSTDASTATQRSYVDESVGAHLALPPLDSASTHRERMVDHNRRLALHAVRVHGPLTLLELQARIGLSPRATARVTNQLVLEKLLLDDRRLRRQRASPARLYVVNPDGCYSIGLSIDCDRATLVIVDFLGNVRARYPREIALPDPPAVRRLFERSVPEWLGRARIPRERLIGVGVALSHAIAHPRLLDQPKTYATWAFVPVDELISEAMDIPVFIENDVVAAAVAEAELGLGLRYRSFFYLRVTGALRGGLVADGRFCRGTNGCPEIAWLNVRDGAPTADGPQSIVSISCLYNRLAERGFRVATQSGLSRLVPAAQAVLEDWVEESAEALIQPILAINCLNRPDAILICGQLPTFLIDRLASLLNRRIASFAADTGAVAPVVRALEFEDAPALGAAVLPFRDRWLRPCSASSLLFEGARLVPNGERLQAAERFDVSL